MQARTHSKDHSPHVTDERFNTASHLVAGIFALLGTAWLIVEASVAGSPWHIVTFSIYGASLIALFSASALHHGIDGSDKVEETLRSVDYMGIYLLIAGTMTPVCLALLGTTLAWCVFGVVWSVGLAGLVVRAVRPDLPKWISATMYGGLGALGIVLAIPVYLQTGVGGMGLLALGGFFYFAGSAIFNIEKPNLLPGRFGFHELWHLFVIAGAASHFAFIALYIRP